MAYKHETWFILKAMVDKKNNKVIFVESNSDFVDVLLSFLTIPLGTIISLARKQSVPIGMNPLNNLYKSVEAMDVKNFNFPDESRNRLLLSPQNGVYFYYQNLKIQLQSWIFCCASTDCTIKTYKLLSTYRDVLCRCDESTIEEICVNVGSDERQMRNLLIDLSVSYLFHSATLAREISDVTFEGSIVNLHKSAQYLGEKFFNSSHHKEILVNPIGLPLVFAMGMIC
ncbi:hypothetical protein PanWU01x14_078880 [Parasponia andersonii]|uniref:Uncharacterized protein n=1 Tax=Parasponia andersonii TaxID=3476 RepID=A0A2P5DC55_PARAD|nr:hypothetical protein PanWU01x14_078880 [Parasponia andersonii]